MGEIYGESPRPWTLVIGIPQSSSEEELVASLPGTVVRRDDPEEIRTVRQEDFNAAIIFGDAPILNRQLMVIQIGGSGWLETIRARNIAYRLGGFAQGHSTLLSIETENIPDDVTIAQQRSLAEHIKNQQPHVVLRRVVGTTWDHEGITPLVREKSGEICCGWWQRGAADGPEWWWFPRHTPDLPSWRSAIYSKWNSILPHAFPADTNDWTRSPEWMTPEEEIASKALDEHKKETERIYSSRKAEEEQLTETLQRVSAESDASTRLLLTAQGKPLVSAVASALVKFGFTVVDSDDGKEQGAYLLEDLKVSYGEWVCLAEVRGYAKGAKTSDFQRIERAVRHYEREHSNVPSGRWYIVNHNIKASPSLRPPVLAGATDDIEVFAEEHGLVVDTRDLFKLAKRVEEGTLSPDSARAHLMGSTGVFDASTTLDGEPQQEE
ncbi:hypothetical protein [Streptomyces nigra]|uniref:hypothetical protein n=1 Tax=Streptomyces nigra TaxID=1827580 RepID=UPI000F4DC940|nr:hypothetical protein [Streptomyces nigra]